MAVRSQADTCGGTRRTGWWSGSRRCCRRCFVRMISRNSPCRCASQIQNDTESCFFPTFSCDVSCARQQWQSSTIPNDGLALAVLHSTTCDQQDRQESDRERPRRSRKAYNGVGISCVRVNRVGRWRWWAGARAAWSWRWPCRTASPPRLPGRPAGLLLRRSSREAPAASPSSTPEPHVHTWAQHFVGAMRSVHRRGGLPPSTFRLLPLSQAHCMLARGRHPLGHGGRRHGGRLLGAGCTRATVCCHRTPPRRALPCYGRRPPQE